MHELLYHIGLVDCLDTDPIVVVLLGVVCFKCFVSVLVSMRPCMSIANSLEIAPEFIYIANVPPSLRLYYAKETYSIIAIIHTLYTYE